MSFFDDEDTEIVKPQTVKLKVRNRPSEPTTAPDVQPSFEASTLDEQKLFQGLKTVLPFFLNVEIPETLRQELSLAVTNETPPMLKSIHEDKIGGERALMGRIQEPDLKATRLPTCGLLGCYLPTSKGVVLYNRGIDIVCTLLAKGFREAIPHQLTGRPLPELYSPHPEQNEAALRVYIRWLLVELVLMHQLGHAVIHLGLTNEVPWREPQRFERLPLEVHEHLAQSIVVASLSVNEITLPFPSSDLTAVFHRLCLHQSRHYRAWVLTPPWSGPEDIASTLIEIREKRVPLRFASL